MKKILILDDDPDILNIIETLLMMEQFDVMTTDTCVDFILLAEQCRPNCIILDYRLSDGNGGELCRRLKAHQVLKNTPVLMFSAYSQPGFNFMDFGCDEFIAKPFDVDQLIFTVKRLTENSFILPSQNWNYSSRSSVKTA